MVPLNICTRGNFEKSIFYFRTQFDEISNNFDDKDYYKKNYEFWFLVELPSECDTWSKVSTEIHLVNYCSNIANVGPNVAL